MVVIGYNLQVFADRREDPLSSAEATMLDKPFIGITANTYSPMPNYSSMACPAHSAWKRANNSMASRSLKALIEQPTPPLDSQDPYGISGLWRRVRYYPPPLQNLTNTPPS